MKSSIIKKRSIISLVLILILIGVSYLNIIALTDKETETGKFINISGKQRMLSQRIVLLSKRYHETRDPYYQKQLLTAIDTMHRNFLFLKDRSKGALQHIYEGRNYRLNYYLGEFLAKAEAVAKQNDPEALTYLLSIGDYILKTSDTATVVFERQYNDYIHRIRYQSTAILIVSFMILVGIYYLILRPAIRTNEKLIKELMDSEEKISEITDNTDSLIYVKDLEGRYLFANEKFEAFFDLDRKTLQGRTDADLFHYELFPKSTESVRENAKKVTVEESIVLGEKRFFFLIEKFPVKTGTGTIYGFCGIATDITPMKDLQREVDEYVKIVDENVITSRTDLSGKITYASEAFCKISGFDKEELIGKHHRIIRHPDMPDKIFTELWKTVTHGGTWQGEIKNRTKDGGSYWVDTTISPNFDLNGYITGFTAIRQDITDKKRIEEISITDELTGLYNRRFFNKIITQELHRARREHIPFTFVILDVDNFKKYNDTYGHQKGDDVLAAIGGVLKEITNRAGDYAFRLGGEEFGAIVNSESGEKSRQFAELLRTHIEALGIEHEKNLPSGTVTASIGVRILTGEWDKHDENTIYKEADALLYDAKENGRNRVESKED